MDTCVLVITDNFDTHADFICPKITHYDTRVFRFDTNNLERYQIDLMPDLSKLLLVDKSDGDLISADEITSVWYRRPSPDRKADELIDADGLKFFRGETKEWIKSITFALKHCFWVTAPWLLYESRIKSRQLSVAQALGLQVPRTLITMDPDSVKRFYSECQDGMVAKPLKVPFVESKESFYTLRVQEINPADLDNPALYICPTVFQEKISVSHELRIVAIGHRLFAFKAVTKEKNALDIRSGGLGNVEYSACEISEALSSKIISMLSQFNTPFSSMDFLVDCDGREYFVDLNPNGQWLFLEFLTGVNMSDVFVEMLISCRMPT